MNTSKRGDAEGIGFAISIRETKQRLSHLSKIPYTVESPTARPTRTPDPYNAPRPTRRAYSTPRPTRTPIPYYIPTPTIPSRRSHAGFLQFDLGTVHGCAIKADHSIVCWGKNNHGQASPPAGQYKEVNVGTEHSCAIRVDDTVACWGSNESFSGTLRSGTVITSSYIGQANPPTGHKFQRIEANRWHTCGILIDGSIECWGGDTHIVNNKSQLTHHNPWVNIPGGSFVAIDLGHEKHCAVRSGGQIQCWGFYPKPVPTGTYQQVSIGDDHNCAVRTDGQLKCWTNTNPESLTGSTPPAGTFHQVSVGYFYTCGVRSDLSVVCWRNTGDWPYGVNNSDYGQAAPPPGRFLHVVASTSTTCGLKVDGTIECWGKDDFGQATPPDP